MKKWKLHHYVKGAYEIAREGESVGGGICVVYKKEEAEYIVSALNFYDERKKIADESSN